MGGICQKRFPLISHRFRTILTTMPNLDSLVRDAFSTEKKVKYSKRNRRIVQDNLPTSSEILKLWEMLAKTEPIEIDLLDWVGRKQAEWIDFEIMTRVPLHDAYFVDVLNPDD